MRDSTLMRMLSEVEGSAVEGASSAVQIAILTKQRLIAYENVFLKSRLSFVWCLVLTVLAPARVWRKVDAEHDRLIQEHQRRIQEKAHRMMTGIIPASAGPRVAGVSTDGPSRGKLD